MNEYTRKTILFTFCKYDTWKFIHVHVENKISAVRHIQTVNCNTNPGVEAIDGASVQQHSAIFFCEFMIGRDVGVV